MDCAGGAGSAHRPVIDVLVVGGGPAGAAAAWSLARSGRRPLIVERSASQTEPVCGQFLGPDAVHSLARMGLHPADLGAVLITRLMLGHRHVRAAMDLPFTGWSLPRRTMDAALLDCAGAAGAQIRRGVSVRSADQDDDGWRIRLDDDTWVQARDLVVASGKHALRGFARRPGGSVGLKLHLRLCCPLDATVLLPGRGFYAGLQPGPDGLANLCAAFRSDPPGDVAGFIAKVAQASDLGAQLLDGAVSVQPRPTAIAGVPYGWMFGGRSQAFRIGDQFAVVPSFCGDGVAMALAGGLLLGEAAGSGPDAFHRTLRARLAKPMRWAAPAGALFAHTPGLVVCTAALIPPLARLLAAQARVVPA